MLCAQVNNYDKDVINGDVGTVVSVARDGRVVVDFDATAAEDGVKEFTVGEAADELTLAYAITIHKVRLAGSLAVTARCGVARRRLRPSHRASRRRKGTSGRCASSLRTARTRSC